MVLETRGVSEKLRRSYNIDIPSNASASTPFKTILIPCSPATRTTAACLSGVSRAFLVFRHASQAHQPESGGRSHPNASDLASHRCAFSNCHPQIPPPRLLSPASCESLAPTSQGSCIDPCIVLLYLPVPSWHPAVVPRSSSVRLLNLSP